MDLNLNPHERKLVDTAREFTREMVVPNAEQWELARKVPIDTIRAAASAGLLGLLVPREHDGQGLSYTAVARINVVISRATFKGRLSPQSPQRL